MSWQHFGNIVHEFELEITDCKPALKQGGLEVKELKTEFEIPKNEYSNANILGEKGKNFLSLLVKIKEFSNSLKEKNLPLPALLPTFSILNGIKNICLMLYSNIEIFLIWFREIMDVVGFTPYTIERDFKLSVRKKCMDELQSQVPDARMHPMFQPADPRNIGVLLPRQIYTFDAGRQLIIQYQVQRFLHGFKRFRNGLSKENLKGVDKLISERKSTVETNSMSTATASQESDLYYQANDIC